MLSKLTQCFTYVFRGDLEGKRHSYCPRVDILHFLVVSLGVFQHGLFSQSSDLVH